MKSATLASRRLLIAMTCYAILALIGVLALDGVVRGALLCFLAILAVKTFIHAKREQEEGTPFYDNKSGADGA
jgi:hypothetical protein